MIRSIHLPDLRRAPDGILFDEGTQEPVLLDFSTVLPLHDQLHRWMHYRVMKECGITKPKLPILTTCDLLPRLHAAGTGLKMQIAKHDWADVPEGRALKWHHLINEEVREVISRILLREA